MNDFFNTPDNKKQFAGDFDNAMGFIKSVTENMKGASEKDIWRAVVAEAEKAKKEGRLTDGELDAFFAALYPMLDGGRRKKLKEIIEKLKGI